MILNNKKINLAAVACFMFTGLNLQASPIETDHDILLEIKGAVFKPTNDNFRTIYNNCPEFGVELTGNMFDRLYAFASADILQKTGETVALTSSTQVTILNLALGAKYFFPFAHGDFYLGLGVEPTFLCTKDETPTPIKQTQWSCGGIAKSGVIVNLPRSLFMDFFFDYTFVASNSYASNPAKLNIAHLDGCLFGVGFGYRFN